MVGPSFCSRLTLRRYQGSSQNATRALHLARSLKYPSSLPATQPQLCASMRTRFLTTNALKLLSKPSQSYTTYHPARLYERVAIITGASSGLGRAIALQYASHGTKLVICADLRSEPRPEGVEQDTMATHDVINQVYGPGRAIFVRADINDSKEVEAAVQTAVKEGGRLDVYACHKWRTKSDQDD